MKIRQITTCAAASVLAAGTILGAAHASERFTLAHAMAPEHIFHPTSEHFIEALGEAYEVEYHPGGDLGDWISLFEQSMQGAIEMTMTFSATEFDPRLNVFIAGYVVDNWADARELYGPGGAIFPVYDEILADLDTKLIGVLPVDFVGYAMRKGVGKVPVNLPDEANGIKMRVPSQEIAIKRFEALGFSPVPMAFSELYTALQLGSVDARAFGPPSEIWQMRDVLESYVYSKDYFEHAYWMVNKSWWDGLSDEDRTNIQAAADKAVEWAWNEAEAISNKTLDDVRGAGIEVVEFTDEQLSAVKKIVYEQEWPFMERVVGAETINALKAAAGIN
ncbi:MAG: TRAP transporter substrate-binding protein DctP [Qingshengfaniella sp.]